VKETSFLCCDWWRRCNNREREAELERLQGLWYRGADKSLARPGSKQATATEEFDFHISYL